MSYICMIQSVAKFSTTHTVWHIVYNADSTSTSLHLVLALSTLLAGSLIGLSHPEPAPVLLLSDLMIGKETHCKNRWSHQLPLNWSRLQSISTSCQEMELWLMTHRKRVQWAKFCKLLIISTSSLWFPLGAKPINASPPSVGGGSSPIPW